MPSAKRSSKTSCGPARHGVCRDRKCRNTSLAEPSQPDHKQQGMEYAEIASAATQVSPSRRSPTTNPRATTEALLLYTHTQILSTSPAPCAHSAARTQQHTRVNGRGRPVQPRQMVASHQLKMQLRGGKAWEKEGEG